MKKESTPRPAMAWYRIVGTNRIVGEPILGISGRGKYTQVDFPDGGWNPVEDCYFTKEQCRRAHNDDRC